MEPLEGIARADEHLGRAVPLPAAALPLGRWTEVFADGPGTVEVVWNLDDTRDGAPGRLALRVSLRPSATQLADAAVERLTIGGVDAQRRSAPLAQAQPSLRPVTEVQWQDPGGLYLRLTAQGPWEAGTLLAVAASMSG